MMDSVIECEYCGRDDVVLYAWHADAWCSDCMRIDHRWHDGLLDSTPTGRPSAATYEQPFVLQTPDGRVRAGVVVQSGDPETGVGHVV